MPAQIWERTEDEKKARNIHRLKCTKRAPEAFRPVIGKMGLKWSQLIAGPLSRVTRGHVRTPLIFFFLSVTKNKRYLYVCARQIRIQHKKASHFELRTLKFKNSLIGLTNGMSASSLFEVCASQSPYWNGTKPARTLPRDIKKKQWGGIPNRGDTFLILWPPWAKDGRCSGQLLLPSPLTVSGNSPDPAENLKSFSRNPS